MGEQRSVRSQVFFTGRAPTVLARTMVFMVCVTMVFSGVFIKPQSVQAQPSFSLKDVPRPVPTAVVFPLNPADPTAAGTPLGLGGDLNFQDLITAGIVKNQAALIQLGKALFWDMQVGSDGIQSCATCHFSAGADIRTKNQLSPGLLDQNFTNNPLGGNGDSFFGNSTVPFTAHDPLAPGGGSQPPNPALNVPGYTPRFAPNYELVVDDFPLYEWFPATFIVPRGDDVTFAEEFFTTTRDTNDVVSSQGVRRTRFVAVQPGRAVDRGTPLPDIFNVVTPGQLNLNGRVRRVEPRNAPTMVNAVFNFDNFWDGRASFIFNGVNPFGFRDRSSTLKLNVEGELTDVFIRVTNSSLASQAVGPPGSDFEMSWAGRTFPDIGKKMVSLRPLNKQLVHPQDSVLGPMSRARVNAGKVVGQRGLNVTTYADMIRAAFQDQWWDNPDIITVLPGTAALQRASSNDPRTMTLSPGKTTVSKGINLLNGANAAAPVAANQFTQMMFNFSLFWGLAVQAYEATLIADDTPLDNNTLTAQEQKGLDIFRGQGKCDACHKFPVTSNHSIFDIKPNAQGVPDDIVETMNMAIGPTANYDQGFYNISERRTTEDLSRAGTAPDAPPFLNPLDENKPFPLSYVALNVLRFNNQLPPDVARFTQVVDPPQDRLAIRGGFKVPQLRNVEFTGPYMASGQQATLRQVVEFYTRGGNFPNTNLADFDPDVEGIPDLVNPFLDPAADANIDALVAFLSRGLTDDRTKFERAPFDHPQLFIPNGANRAGTRDIMKEIPAVGAAGAAQAIPRFLNLDPNFSNPF